MAAQPSPWPTIHAERAALAADLTGLTPAQWATPSLCAGWSVQQTLGHLVATARLTPPRFLAHLARAGFRFGVMAERDVAAESAGSPADTLARFVAVQDATTSPPGPVDSWLGEVVVHAEDIRRPLGIGHDYPVDAVVRVLSFYKDSNLLIGSKKRVAGLRLVATDAEWTHGSGPEVTGPALSLLMAMTGRKAHLADLAGPGLGELTSR